MNRRRCAVLVTACALIALPSCATFNRNDLAAKVGDRSLTAKAAETLAAAGGQPATGDQLREQLTKWIRVTVLEASVGTAARTAPTTSADLDARLDQAIAGLAGDKAKALYETGLSSPVICLAAITVASLADANTVLATLTSGTPFADLARQKSTDTVIAQAGGIVKGGPNGDQECLAPAGVNTAVVAALKDTPVGQPIAADLGTFSAVLMLRPYEDLLPSSQALLANAVVSQDQLDAIVDAATIYVDPRYGRWDPDTGAVVMLST